MKRLKLTNNIRDSYVSLAPIKMSVLLLILMLILSPNIGPVIPSFEGQDNLITIYSDPTDRVHIGTRCLPESPNTTCNSMRSHIRTFINGGTSPQFLAQNFDIFAWGNLNAKSLNPNAINLRYEFLDWLEGSSKYQALLDYCDLNNLNSNDIEDMYLHAKEDVFYALGQPTELDPMVTKLVPGWDPVNDLNGDYYIDNAEYAKRINQNASARYKNESKIPIYYWGPPTNYQTNPGNANYQDFFVTYYLPDLLVDGYDGLWIDTLHTYPTLQDDTIVLEYPDLNQYALDKNTILTDLVDFLPDDTIIIGNGWYSDPMIISGREIENWVRITMSIDTQKLDAIIDSDEQGIMQLIQYRPIYHDVANPNRPDLYVEGVTLERDQMYSLALYYLVHGDHTYYGYGTHGSYLLDEERWFDAVNYDIGQITGSYYIFDDSSGYTKEKENILINSDFEIDDDFDGNPDYWVPSEPVELDSTIKYEGNYSVKIQTDEVINNMNYQTVTLKPYTTYTVSGRIKTENVTDLGAQIYVYEFDDLQECDPWIKVRGTTDWTFYNMSFTTGSDTVGNIKYRIMYGTGTAWFDDLHLTEGRYKKYTVFARDFENATVLLKTPFSVGDNTTTSYDLEEYYWPLNANGTLGASVNTIELMGGEGVILIRQEDAPVLHLKNGWNFISLPVIPDVTDIESVLHSVEGSYDAVQWFDASDKNDPWKHFTVGKSFGNDLTNINVKMGFLIHITAYDGATLYLNCTIPTSKQNIQLYKGWNMVGFPSLSNRNRTLALNNIDYPDDVDAILTYNSQNQRWERMGESDNFEIGRGYYIHSKVTKVWDVPLLPS